MSAVNAEDQNKQGTDPQTPAANSAGTTAAATGIDGAKADKGKKADKAPKTEPATSAGTAAATGIEKKSHTAHVSSGFTAPTAMEIDAAANNADFVAACRKVIKRADEIKAGNVAPAKMSSEVYDRLVKKYGKDFVTAQKGTNTTYFSRRTFSAMSGNKQGWKEVSQVMPETQN